MSETVKFEKIGEDKVLVTKTTERGDVTTIKKDTILITAQIAAYDAEKQNNAARIDELTDYNTEISGYIRQLEAL